MKETKRSECPINMSVEILGDRWSLVILRDMMFGGVRRFNEMLANSLEGIASNILSDRLKMLVERGLLTKAPDPAHSQKIIYSLTEQAIDLVPLMAHLGAWGSRWLAPSRELSIRALLLEQGGPKMWERFQADLRADHLGAPRRRGPAVAEQLQAAYEAEAARRKG